jgi:hypothetical protein
MRRILKSLTIVALPVLACGLISCRTTAPDSSAPPATGPTGIPVGRWATVYEFPAPVFKVSNLRNVITLRPDGTGFRTSTYHYEYKPGYSISQGKFKGYRMLKWTETKTVGTVKRLGDKIYMYGDPKAKASLVEGYPAGFALDDYYTFGGALPQGISAYSSGPGVSIFSMSGKDLILENSDDNHRWLYKWIGN